MTFIFASLNFRDFYQFSKNVNNWYHKNFLPQGSPAPGWWLTIGIFSTYMAVLEGGKEVERYFTLGTGWEWRHTSMHSILFYLCFVHCSRDLDELRAQRIVGLIAHKSTRSEIRWWGKMRSPQALSLIRGLGSWNWASTEGVVVSSYRVLKWKNCSLVH